MIVRTMLRLAFAFATLATSTFSQTPPWGTPVNTGISHTISVPLSATPTINGTALVSGDYIGVFYTNGGTQVCGGLRKWDGSRAVSVPAWGDDPTTTSVKDGFSSGEKFQWRLWRASDGKEVTATASYAAVGSSGGLVTATDGFQSDGFSQLTSLAGSYVVDNPVLGVDQTSWTAPAGGGTSGSIRVTNTGTGGAITYSVSDDADWITTSSTGGTTPGSFTITAAANTTGSARTATVAITATGATGSPKQVTITQATAPTGGDTIYVPGGTLVGRENAGSLETAINTDVTASGARVNPNRVYALNEGQYYFQLAPIIVNNPTGTLTIVSVPSSYGKTKPIILISPSPGTNEGTNTVYGSIKCEGIHYQAQQLNGHTNSELFYCGTANKLPQSLTINNCLFEFSYIDLFDCTNETGAIGGWPYGAKFKITNSYFRNMFEPSQWWGSRIFQCKHPIDTLWVENCTVTTGGLTFLQQYQLTDFMYINHNTIVNNKKYWLLSPYHKSMFITNNIFINQNWVGEDTNVTNSGQDPDKYFQSTINVDTNNATNGLVVQGKYYAGDSSHFVSALDFNKLQVYISDNINYYDPLLINGYYNSSTYKYPALGTLPSYLDWNGYGSGPWKVQNIPGQWMNTRTKALFAAYGPPNGGFIEKRTSTENPGTVTPGIADASVVDMMAVWSQNQWGDPAFPTSPAITSTKYVYGDYDPTTLPGIVNGVKTDAMTMGQAGISKFTDLTENFSQSSHLSAIDGLPVGALIWDDAKNAAYISAGSASEWQLVYNEYLSEGGLTAIGTTNSGVSVSFNLAQNYPNPFNPSTIIRYGLPHRTHVTLTVFNTLGQQVAQLVNADLDAGYHEIQFKASNLASGVYFYRIQAGSYIETKNLLLVR